MALPQAQLFDILKDKWTRLNTFYWIIDEHGKRVQLKLNHAQTTLFDEMWYMNLILKSRQHGFTTFIDIYILDECLFNDNIEAGIIAHRMEDAQKIFRRKIKYPYDNLPDQVKDARPLQTDSKSELVFNNDSLVYVSTSMRSGTVQLLHISEFAYVCAKRPDRAEEIATGSLEAIHPGEIVWIECTAEGSEGLFYDYCDIAQTSQKMGRQLSKLEFKFFFYAWYQKPENILEDPVPIPKELAEYFKKIEVEVGQTFTDQQKWWYAAKKQLHQDKMFKEHPSVPEEAFAASIEGAYYATQMRKALEEKRIGVFPFQEGLPVDTWWDLGMDDSMSIWATQEIYNKTQFIWCFEDSGEGLQYYADILDKKAQDDKWVFGRHYAPHDIKVRELGTGKSRLESASKHGLNFEIVDRPERKEDGIQACRDIFPYCYFDNENCSEGIRALKNYRKEWDEKRGTFHNHPLHNWACHFADAFETFALGHGVDARFGRDDLDEAFK